MSPLSQDSSQELTSPESEASVSPSVLEAKQSGPSSNTDARVPESTQHTLRKRPWRRRVAPFEKILATKYRGSGTSTDPFIVQWLDNDPENPKTSSNLFKWLMTFLLAFMTLCVSLASSAYTGAARLIIEEFHCNQEVFLLGLSLMVAGFALGPLVWAPLSEMMGRREILMIALVFYILFTAVCAAAHDIATLVVLRLLCGTFGSAVFVIPGGQLSDMFDAEQRGSEYPPLSFQY